MSLDKTKNERELEWLHHQPERLIEHYQPVIGVIVNGFVKKGFFHSKDRMDLIQEINLQLLETKIEKIKTHFNNSVQLRTYFSKVIYNACMEMARSYPQKQVSSPEIILEGTSDKTPTPIQQLAIKEEVVKFHGCLLALPKLRLKATLCLKAIAKIPFNQTDLQFLQSPKTEDEIKKISQHLFNNYNHLQHREVFGFLAPLFNKVENKSVDGESLRKWTNSLLDRFIVIMNGNPPHSAYTRDTLKILLQFYFTEKD